MKLYFSPGACSLAPHIVLCEAGLSCDLEKVDLGTKRTAGGADFKVVNPKGYVPALQLDSGAVLTEVTVVVQYLADLAPEKHLVPAAGTLERYRVMEWLNFIATELHKGFSPLFKAEIPAEAKALAIANLSKRLDFVCEQLQRSTYLAGDQFNVADTYLFTVLRWARYVKFDLAPWPAVQAYLKRVAARPAVHAAMLAEGLVKNAA
ncbi:MAG TPA: glutathione transferase GstA [Burkholderiaceae bacterium]|nr:glutathione transferase GstA [Burkholderiaceae bacterium]